VCDITSGKEALSGCREQVLIFRIIYKMYIPKETGTYLAIGAAF
jgi:hypothetical protein